MIFAAGLAIKSAVDPTTRFEFSLEQAQISIRDNMGWLGAILAVTYAGFYARYASQWNYIASLYNQIMATASTLDDTQRNAETFLNWQAAFIEDCFYLHLDRKEVFKIVIKQMLDNESILECFKESAPDDVVSKVLARNSICGSAA